MHPISLDELRQHVLKALTDHPLFSDAEQRADYSVYECEYIAQLINWGESVLAEIVRCKTTARTESAFLRRQCALRNALWQMHPASFRCLRRPAHAQLVSFLSHLYCIVE